MRDTARQYAHNRRYARQRHAAVKAFVDDYKATHPCRDCGQLFPPECMDFDHLDPATKRAGVSRMVGTERGIALVWAEINKCELVCANCHRTRTRKRREAQEVGL